MHGPTTRSVSETLGGSQSAVSRTHSAIEEALEEVYTFIAFDKSILISGVFFLLVSMSLDSCIGECSFISIDSLIVIFNTTFRSQKVKTKLFD